MDRGALQATIHRVAKSWTRLSDSAHAHTHTNRITQKNPACLAPLAAQGLARLLASRGQLMSSFVPPGPQ